MGGNLHMTRRGLLGLAAFPWHRVKLSHNAIKSSLADRFWGEKAKELDSLKEMQRNLLLLQLHRGGYSVPMEDLLK